MADHAHGGGGGKGGGGNAIVNGLLAILGLIALAIFFNALTTPSSQAQYVNRGCGGYYNEGCGSPQYQDYIAHHVHHLPCWGGCGPTYLVRRPIRERPVPLGYATGYGYRNYGGSYRTWHRTSVQRYEWHRTVVGPPQLLCRVTTHRHCEGGVCTTQTFRSGPYCN